MRIARTRAALGIALLAGLAFGLAGAGFSKPIAGVLLVGAGLAQLVQAGLLARGVVSPGGTCGFSPRGQALQGTAWLCLACILWAEPLMPEPLGWSVATVALVSLLLGFRAEREAHARHGPA